MKFGDLGVIAAPIYVWFWGCTGQASIVSSLSFNLGDSV